MLRTLPPSGTPIRPRELARWLPRALHPGDAEARLESRLQNLLGVRQVGLASSGRALLYRIFRSLAEGRVGRSGPRTPPGEVIVPGYTCYSVAAAAARAGLRIRPVEVDADTLDYRRESLEAIPTSSAVAIVSSSLYGHPGDLTYLESFAADRGVVLVDDAAQAFLARVDGRFAGTFGHVGIFSLDKGKNLSTIQGGVLLTDDPDGFPVLDILRSLPPSGAGLALRRAFELVGYSLFLHPRLYWIPDRILKLGGTPWEMSAPATRYPRSLAPMLGILLDRASELVEGRTERAGWIRTALLEEVPGGALGGPAMLGTRPGAEPVHLRFPLLLPDRERRDSALAALRSSGLGATASYPRAIIDVHEAREYLVEGTVDTPVARGVADRILTLPTHPYVTPADARTMGRIVGSVLASRSRSLP